MEENTPGLIIKFNIWANEISIPSQLMGNNNFNPDMEIQMSACGVETRLTASLLFLTV